MSTQDETPQEESSPVPTGERVKARMFMPDADLRSKIAWSSFRKEVSQGRGQKEALIEAIRCGADLPNDLEFRDWVADVLEGKIDKRGKGRPQKKRPDFLQRCIEGGIYESYREWYEAFKADRELAWMRFEALRLHEEHPEAEVWRRGYHLGKPEDRLSYETQLKALGARSCPAKLKGGLTPRDFALKATARERREVWRSVTNQDLTPDTVARIVTRAKKSE